MNQISQVLRRTLTVTAILISMLAAGCVAIIEDRHHSTLGEVLFTKDGGSYSGIISGRGSAKEEEICCLCTGDGRPGDNDCGTCTEVSCDTPHVPFKLD